MFKSNGVRIGMLLIVLINSTLAGLNIADINMEGGICRGHGDPAKEQASKNIDTVGLVFSVITAVATLIALCLSFCKCFK